MNAAAFAARFPADPRELVLWGFHPGICDGEPIKLCTHSAAEQRRREACGWTCHAYRGGNPPAGLRVLAAEARKARANTGHRAV